MTYSFGLPGPAVWIFHIILGLGLFYVGYNLLNGKDISQWMSLVLIIVGALGAAYHTHLFYYSGAQ